MTQSLQTTSSVFTYQFYTTLNLLYIKIAGSQTFEDLFNHPQQFMADHAFEHGVNIIYDCEEVTSLIVDEELLQKSATMCCDTEFIPQPAKTIFLTTSSQYDVIDQLLRICDAHEDTRVTHHLCVSVGQSLALLDLSLQDFMSLKAVEYRYGAAY